MNITPMDYQVHKMDYDERVARGLKAYRLGLHESGARRRPRFSLRRWIPAFGRAQKRAGELTTQS